MIDARGPPGHFLDRRTGIPISLALVLSFFVMAPVGREINTTVLQPLNRGGAQTVASNGCAVTRVACGARPSQGLNGFAWRCWPAGSAWRSLGRRC